MSGSTALGLSPDEELKRIEKEIAFLMLTMRDRTMPVDLDRSEWAHPQRDESVLRYRSTNLIRYCVSLFAGMEFLGVITLNDRMTGEPLSIEDFDLLKSIADQSAGILQNRRLFERLGQAKEMEAFQTLSAFFVHDLKNLASTLSLTLQNFPVHYDNPEFREDALRVMSQSVERINSMCARLSMVNQKLELNRTEGDINRLVSETLAGLIQTFKSPPVCELQGVPGVSMDPEQMKKVLTNLVLNASEAIENGGEIRIETCEDNGCVVLSVSDTGCGMSREFVSRSLFHPFKSTKKRGLGIGLYHSKMIVEAHQGRIEVESREGKGSTFRVVMPAGRK